MVFHGTSHEGIKGILKDRKFKGKPWTEGGAGEHGTYGLGFQESKDAEWNLSQLKERLCKVDMGNNDTCGMVVERRMITKRKAITSGGIGRESEEVDINTTTHSKTDDRPCFHRDAAAITALWLTKDILELVDQSAISWLP